jgi:hypothetical protein
VAVSLFVFLTYLLVALGVQNIYPFSTFPMYSESNDPQGARFIGLVDGEPREIFDFVGWTCPEEVVQFGRLACPDGGPALPTEYLVKEATDHIAAHSVEAPSPDAVRVSLVVRTWDLRPGEDDTPRDCPVMQCVAVEQ